MLQIHQLRNVFFHAKNVSMRWFFRVPKYMYMFCSINKKINLLSYFRPVDKQCGSSLTTFTSIQIEHLTNIKRKCVYPT